jgi:hypothetical protein
MQYALLIYGSESSRATSGPLDGRLADVLSQENVTGWARLHAEESATTVRGGDARPLLIDGPFVETKEHLAGLVVVEAADLDGALAIAQELQDTRIGGAIEVRPVFESAFRGA